MLQCQSGIANSNDFWTIQFAHTGALLEEFQKGSEFQLSSGAIAITSFHISRAWGVFGKSKAPTCCRSEIGLPQSERILGRFWELCQKATPGCGLWVAARVGLSSGNNLLEVFQQST